MLIGAAAGGDDDARGKLYNKVFDELHRTAQRLLHHEAHAQSLQPTMLVNDVYMKLVGNETELRFNDRKHFYAVAATAMRRRLVDHARHRLALKNGGANWKPVDVEFDRVVKDGLGLSMQELLDLHEALKELADLEPEQAEAIELSHFGGCTNKEIAELLDLSERTVNNRLRMAREWLRKKLRP